MKRLIIVRHAKSSWEFNIEDRDRPLIPKGITRAQKHSELLKKNIDFDPDVWMSSPANRGLHTAVIFAGEMNRLKDLKINPELYTFSSSTLLSVLNELPDEANSAIIFSHNDACHNVVNHLANAGIPYFKTASVALMEFTQNSWSEIGNGKLNLLISQEEIKL